VLPDDPRDASNPFKRLDVLALHPTSTETRRVVNEVLEEIARVFSDMTEYIHLGGDEMNRKCWTTDESVVDDMRRAGYSNARDAETAFHKNNAKVLKGAGMRSIFWQDAFDSGVLSFFADERTFPSKNKDVVVMPWKCWGGRGPSDSLAERSARRARANGFSVVRTDCFYLDWNSDWKHFATKGTSWLHGDTDGDDTTLGGGAALWTERVDFTNAEW